MALHQDNKGQRCQADDIREYCAVDEAQRADKGDKAQKDVHVGKKIAFHSDTEQKPSEARKGRTLPGRGVSGTSRSR